MEEHSLLSSFSSQAKALSQLAESKTPQGSCSKEQILTIYPNLATVYSIKEIANKNFAPIVKVKEEPKPIKSALKKQKKNDSFQGKRIKFDLPSPENSMNLQESSQKIQSP
ncbi:MAG: hypothetical protein HWD61_00555 [Parachlamydiaceae bacterium]|nr:MAG: hypothetical protein HWD61_00555 [Parachlamydiaceae bacterium]